jgi:hypothetical protein
MRSCRWLQVLVPDDEVPPWNNRKLTKDPARPGKRPTPIAATPSAPPTNLHVLSVFLVAGPVSDKFAKKVIRRDIEIRGDQTLDQLHAAIFAAYDRFDEHLYEFQMGKRPFDPAGPEYGAPASPPRKKRDKDARATKMDDLGLKPNRVFGYRFDFGDEWYHEVHVHRIEHAIPTVTYPRVIKRVGKAPPQYAP